MEPPRPSGMPSFDAPAPHRSGTFAALGVDDDTIGRIWEAWPRIGPRGADAPLPSHVHVRAGTSSWTDDNGNIVGVFLNSPAMASDPIPPAVAVEVAAPVDRIDMTLVVADPDPPVVLAEIDPGDHLADRGSMMAG